MCGCVRQTDGRYRVAGHRWIVNYRGAGLHHSPLHRSHRTEEPNCPSGVYRCFIIMFCFKVKQMSFTLLLTSHDHYKPNKQYNY